MSNPLKNNKQLYADMIQSMMIDFVVHDMKHPALSEKYNISATAVNNIVTNHKFREKRIQYHDKLLNKSVSKLADRQASILTKITRILERQVDRLEGQQIKDQTKLIDPTRMKEVLVALAHLSKEHRLDNDKPTDNMNMSIKVDIGSTPVISENHIINGRVDDIEVAVEPVAEIPLPEEIKVVVETESTDDDIMVFGSLD